MSKVAFIVAHRELGDIVRTEDGTFFYVDSAETFDAGFETMVFPCDEDGQVTSWRERYVEHYESEKEMEQRHIYICRNLEEVLNQ